MVGEIIHVQAGECRNVIGNAFWNTMSAEHKLVKDGKFSGNKEALELRFVQRAALVDLEAASLELIKEAESCDCPQGFQIELQQHFSVYPSQLSGVVVQAYNATL